MPRTRTANPSSIGSSAAKRNFSSTCARSLSARSVVIYTSLKYVSRFGQMETLRHSPADTKRGAISQPNIWPGLRTQIISSVCSHPGPRTPMGYSILWAAFTVERMCTAISFSPSRSAPVTSNRYSSIISSVSPTAVPFRYTVEKVSTPSRHSTAPRSASACGAKNVRVYHHS